MNEAMESDKRGEERGLEDSNLVSQDTNQSPQNQNNEPLLGEWEADPG